MLILNSLCSICLGLALLGTDSLQERGHRESPLPSAAVESPQARPREAPRAQMQFAQASPAAGAKLPNPAKVSVEMIPASSVDIGSKVAFQVKAAKRGYVLLVDIDPAGKMSQIFPNPELLTQYGNADMNLIRPGSKLAIPSEEAHKSGFNYVVTSPAGTAAVVAILSGKKVQLIDLPETLEDQTTVETLGRLSKWIDTLRIPDPQTGKLVPNDWSYDVKPYVIR